MGEEEVVDIYNDNMIEIGSKKRKNVHRDGDWHKSFHCWVIRQEGNKRFLLFQLRGPNKVIFPNKLDITAAGHYRQGEDIKSASRELTEELGIKFSFEDLVYLGTRCEVGAVRKITNREFCEVYLLEHSSPLMDYKLQEEEVTGLVEIELTDSMKLFSSEVKEVTADGVILEEDSKKSIKRKIRRSDMIPRHDNYYLIVSIMAERYFDGKKYLAV